MLVEIDTKFVDPRDGQIYKTAENNGKTWLAENLRYEGIAHYAPNGDDNNIQRYGCLYKWEDALKAIPEGWHLPSKKEFETLLTNVGYSDNNSSKTSINLRATTWNDGLDTYGFGALPAGRYEDGSYYLFSSGAYLCFNACAFCWSATECDANSAYYLYLGRDDARVSYNNKTNYFSVRCIKD